MAKSRRKVDVVVISDVHLGTYGCQAKELLNYLKSIEPKKLVLNGDIMDIWQFKKSYWPRAHMKVVKQLVSFASEGVKTYYVTGNHDEILRKFSGLNLGSFHIVNDFVLELKDGKAWFFHGDVFDVVIQNSKWLAKLGAVGYDLLILINTIINYFSLMMGKSKVSMSKRIKDNVKTAVKYINNFEKTAIRIGLNKGYKYVACGHIHKPQLKEETFEKGKITYLNSGDWVENLTALEYNKGQWSIYEYRKDSTMHEEQEVEFDKEMALVDLKPNVLLAKMFHEFQS
jgi:UDP-2,3-diacylglucosamine pyrophosphatase LpxH